MKIILICILGFLMLTGCDAKDTTPPESSSAVESATKQEQDHFQSALVSEANSEVSETNETEVKSSSQAEVPESSKEVPSESDQPVVNPSSEVPLESGEISEEIDISPPGDPLVMQWTDKIKKERGISDFYAFSVAIDDLEEQIQNTLDDTLYGGLGQIREELTIEKSNEILSETVGIEIFYVDLNKVQPIVEACIKQIGNSAGIIDIEYIQCKYAIHDLKKFESEIQAQPFCKHNILHLMIYGGQLHVTIAEQGNSKDLERFLSDKPYKDAILIKPQYTGYNPLC